MRSCSPDAVYPPTLRYESPDSTGKPAVGSPHGTSPGWSLELGRVTKRLSLRRNHNGSSSRFGSYEVLRELGRGASSVVFLARQPSLNRYVVIKSMETSDAAVREFLTHEASLLAELQHPRIVQIYDTALEKDGRPYLVMPFLAGGSLARLLERDRKLTPGQTVAVLSSVAEALEALHRRGIVHRDVKPSNIFLSDDGDVYLGDFGVGALTSTKSKAEEIFAGTPGYLATEVLRGEPFTAPADVFALGVLGRELLSGEPTGGFLDESVPRALIDLIDAAAARSASDRPSDLREWADSIRETATTERLDPPRVEIDPENVVAGESSDTPTVVRIRKTGGNASKVTSIRRRPPRKVLAGVVVAVFLLLGGSAWAATGGVFDSLKHKAGTEPKALDAEKKSGVSLTSSGSSAPTTTVSIDPAPSRPGSQPPPGTPPGPTSSASAPSGGTQAGSPSPPGTPAGSGGQAQAIPPAANKQLHQVNAVTYNIFDPGPSAWYPLPVSGGSFVEQRFVSTVDVINELGVDTFEGGSVWRVSLLSDVGAELASASVTAQTDVVARVGISPVSVKKGSVYRVRASPPWASTNGAVWVSPGNLYPPGEANRNGSSLAGVDNRWTAQSDAGLYAAGYRME